LWLEFTIIFQEFNNAVPVRNALYYILVSIETLEKNALSSCINFYGTGKWGGGEYSNHRDIERSPFSLVLQTPSKSFMRYLIPRVA
jgi:hypothetical protein